jgi:hypothetical protein
MQRFQTCALALAAALLVGCGSSGMGDILGGGSDYPNETLVEVSGTVRGVDVSGGDCAIELTESRTYESNLRDGYGNDLAGDVLFCDDRTEVVHDGRSYRPDALERGDRIVARARQVGGRLHAERIEVTYDVSSGNDPYYEDDRSDDRYDDRYDDDRTGSTLYGDLRGIVYRVDTGRRTIELERVEVLDRALGFDRDEDRMTIYYETDTEVTFEGRRYSPENLERGDVVEVEVDQVRGQLVADEIAVIEDARDRSARN